MTLVFTLSDILIFCLTQRHAAACTQKGPTLPPTPAPTSCRRFIKTTSLYFHDNSNIYEVNLPRGCSDYSPFEGEKLSTPLSTSCRLPIGSDNQVSLVNRIFNSEDKICFSDYPQNNLKKLVKKALPEGFTPLSTPC